MLQEIYIIDDNIELYKLLKSMFKDEKEFLLKNVRTTEIEIALKNIPSLIIIHEDQVDRDLVELCNTIRQNEDNSITPIIVVSSDENKDHRIDVLKTDVEYYIKEPIDKDYFYYTIKNIVNLMYLNRRVSPLTGLPGNVQIQAEIKKRLLNQEHFAILYFDLDNFKAYNDTYGFLKGDEIIKFTAKIISKHIHKNECDNAFIGHIGGDDFVAIVSETDYEKICQDIILEFDIKVLDYFNDEDKEKGYVEVVNRKGIIEQFPITSISIAVVDIEKNRFKNALEIAEMGAGIKHLAKTTLGSTYIINRRKK